MENDVSVTRLDVVKGYNSKLGTFRDSVLVCGAVIDREVRKFKSAVEEKKKYVKAKLGPSKTKQDSLGIRYNKARERSLPGIDVIGDSDHQIQMKYQVLEAAVKDYLHVANDLMSKLGEIGQETKTFCTVLDSETLGCSKKLSEMIAHMDEMCFIKKPKSKCSSAD